MLAAAMLPTACMSATATVCNATTVLCRSHV